MLFTHVCSTPSELVSNYCYFKLFLFLHWLCVLWTIIYFFVDVGIFIGAVLFSS